MSKIYGIPVGTPMNPDKLKEDVVKTVNNVAPDKNGNVEVGIDSAIQPLTFTGAVTGEYNGSKAVNIEVPVIAGPQGEQGPAGPQGEQGPQGDQGPQGSTPVKGIDYFTDSDVDNIAAQAAAKVTPEGIGARPNTWTPTASDVGAVPATADSTHTSCYYRIVDGVKEWINPPTASGVEYRTTERFEGKPVYIKNVWCEYLPNNNTKTVAHGVSGVSRFLSVVGYVQYSNGIPGRTVISEGGISVKAETTDIQIATTWDASKYRLNVILKYIKN